MKGGGKKKPTLISSSPEDQAIQFVEAVFPDDLDDDEAIEVFRLPGAVAQWARSRAEVARLALDLSLSGRDAYVGVSTKAYKSLGSHARGTEDHALSNLAVVLDVDVGTDGHPNGKRRPPTEEAALALLAALPLKPSLVVRSGGGLHAWYLFKEPLSIRTPSQKNLARGCSAGWHEVAQREASKYGWTLDATHDLVRVFRIPGTKNYKLRQNPRPVELLMHDPKVRYSVEDFEPFAKTIIESFRMGLGGLDLDANAEMPNDVLNALLVNDATFLATWRGERKDMRDQSPSAYCLALANSMADAGLPRQTICDGLIQWRRTNGHDLKLREDWYARTIDKALDRKARGGAVDDGPDEIVAQEIEALNEVEEVDVKRALVLKMLSQFTGLGVERITYASRDPATYCVHLAGGDHFIVESTEKLLAWKTWREKAFEFQSLGIPAQPPSKKNWDRLISNLAGLTTYEPDEDALVTSLREYLEGAVDLSDIEETEARNQIVLHSRPIRLREPGSPLAFAPDALRKWLTEERGQRLGTEGLRARLRGMGFIPKTLGAQKSGRPTSRRYWCDVDGRAEVLLYSEGRTRRRPESPSEIPPTRARTPEREEEWSN